MLFNGVVVEVLAGELVARNEALRALTEAADRARDGDGACWVVAGEPGVGKSRLVREAVDIARRRGLRSFVGRAVAGEVLLGPLVSAFVGIGRSTPFPPAPELDAFRSVLGHLVPDWSPPVADPVPPERVAPLIAEGLLRLVRVLAPEGAVLVIEDLHAADQTTLTVLDHLNDALPSSRLAVLVTLRPGSASADRWLAASLSRRSASVLDLAPLDEHDTAALVAACLEAPAPTALVEYVVEHSDGLPLLVEDLLATMLAAGVLAQVEGRWTILRPLEVGVPRTFAEAVEERLRAIPPDAVRILRAAAVLGRRFDWRVLPAMVGLRSDEVLHHLRAAVHHLLVITGRGEDEFAFRHALTRDVVLAGLLPPERMRLAAQAAAALDELADDDATLLRSAALHAEAGAPDRAAVRLLELGRRSAARGALEIAGDALSRARRLPTEAALADEIDQVLVEVHAAAGRVVQAFEVGERLLARATEQMAPAVRLCLARAAVASGHWEHATAQLDAIPEGSPEQASAASVRASVAVSLRDPARAEALARSALDLARAQSDAEATCEALQVMGRAVRSRSPREAHTWFERSLATAERSDLALWQVRALHELGTIDLFETGRTDRLEAARGVARSLGMHDTVGHVELHLGILLAHRGDHEGAEAMLRSVISLAAPLRLHGLERVATAQLGYAFALAGDEAAAQQCIATVMDEGISDDATRIAMGLAAPLARLLREDRPGAVALVDEAVRSSSDFSWPQWGLRALLHAVEGDDRAAAELDSARPPAQRGRLQHAYLLYALAVVRGRAGDADGARAAVAAGHEQLGWQVAHRRFCVRQLGEAALRDGWGDPVIWLTQALDEFRGANAVASACRRLIKDAGGKVPRAGRGVSDVPASLREFGVTSREVDVLKLLAQGETNATIAAQLHLSKRTVEGHVASLLAKTGTENRSALARLANPVFSPS